MKRAEFLKGSAVLLAFPSLLAKMAAAPAIPTAIGPATTTILANTAGFRVGDIVRMLSTGEAFLVQSVKPGRLEVSRGVGSIAPTPFGDADGLIVAGAWDGVMPMRPLYSAKPVRMREAA